MYDSFQINSHSGELIPTYVDHRMNYLGFYIFPRKVFQYKMFL